jgi:hypothetical protein
MEYKHCCKGFPEMMMTFRWFSRVDDNGNLLFLMPVIKGTNWRVQYCPSCGKYIRGIEIPEDVFYQTL